MRVGCRPAHPSETPRQRKDAPIVTEPSRLTRNAVQRRNRRLASGLPEPFAGADATPISLEFFSRLINADRRRGLPRERDFVPISVTDTVAVMSNSELSKTVWGGLVRGCAVSSLPRFNRVATLSVQTATAIGVLDQGVRGRRRATRSAVRLSRCRVRCGFG